MKLNQLIGMRTFKTGLAVAITLIICEWVMATNPFFAAISAIFAMESTVEGTLKVVRDRLFGTILGAAIAIGFTMILAQTSITIGLGVILVISICNALKLQGTIKIASIVFLAIALGAHEGNQLNYAFYRTIDTLIGLMVSTLINLFVFPKGIAMK